jgi:crotonobetainyl-CoA:carnitine CoA-transferase CaiB-like acyl-CoA transferase
VPDNPVDHADLRPGPLAGIRILDLTAVVLGPLARQIMGDLGAEVIKLESPEGDIMRYAGPARHPAMGHVFLNLDCNKRSLCLDLKRPEAAELALALVRHSDVLMHNMRPRAMARLGLDYDRVRDSNPRLVYCSAHGYGQSGPLADRPAFDDIIRCGRGADSLLSSALRGWRSTPPGPKSAVPTLPPARQCFGCRREFRRTADQIGADKRERDCNGTHSMSVCPKSSP